jgi:hypothetical protein
MEGWRRAVELWARGERPQGAGTLLDLVWKLAGDEARVRDALRAGYVLVGTFGGREAELLAGSERSHEHGDRVLA